MFGTPTLTGDILLLLIILIIAAHSIYLWRRGQWLALDPLNAFWGGVVFVYVLQPLAYGDMLIKWHTAAVFHETLLYVGVALLSIILGYQTIGWQKLAHRLPAMPARLQSRRLVIAAFVIIGLGLIGYMYMIASAGGLWEWLSKSRGGTDWENVIAYIALLSRFLPLGAALLLFSVTLRPTLRFYKIIVWALSVLILVWFIYLGQRSGSFLWCLTMLAAYYLPTRKNPPLPLLVALFFAMSVLVTFLGHYRQHFRELSFHLNEIDMQEARARALPNVLGGSAEAKSRDVTRGLDFNCVMTAVELVPEQVDYNYGYCLLEFVTRPIPRALWPMKRYPHYEAFTPIYDRGGLSEYWVPTASEPILAGPSFTFVGHWYAVGGPVVLLVAGILTGGMFRMIRTIYDRAPGSEGDVLLYYCLIPIGLSEAVTTPLFWLFTLPFVVIAVLVVLSLCREPRLSASVPAADSGRRTSPMGPADT